MGFFPQLAVVSCFLWGEVLVLEQKEILRRSLDQVFNDSLRHILRLVELALNELSA